MCLFVMAGCKKSPKPPKAAQLLYPLKSSECTTGVNVSGTNTSEVEFKWNAAKRATYYELSYTNLNTNDTQKTSSAQTSLKVVLEKGVPYSWFVVSQSNEVDETAASEIWHFYNAGSINSYAPFPADIISPNSGETVLMDLNNEVQLEWEGTDLDDDILEYDVYFSANNPPTLLSTLASSTTSLKVSVAPNTVYYWKVVTKDAAGHSSDSGVYEFKVN